MTTLQTIPVHFDQEAHTYTNTETGEMYRGITGTLIHRLNPDKYAGIPAATLQAAANKGSVIHSQLELIETLGVDPATEEGKNYVQERDKMGLQFLASEHTVSDLQHYATNIDVIYEAGEGLIDAIIIANDFGSQRGLMISRQMIHDYVMPGAREIIDQAHSYGIKVIYHSCGAVFDAMPEMIDAGADFIHPLQAHAAGMDPKRIYEAYGSKVSFCGGIDIQELLPKGTPEEVRAKVRELKEIFPTGMILSPSQGVLLDDVPPANVAAMLDEAMKIN